MVVVDLHRIDPLRTALVLLLLLVMDALWFSITFTRLYPMLGAVSMQWGLVAWVPLAVAIASADPGNAADAAKWGAAVGFTTYAVFNGTELAIRADWPLTTAAADLVWGCCACATASLVSYFMA
jgi:uncharacterized membrane protein